MYFRNLKVIKNLKVVEKISGSLNRRADLSKGIVNRLVTLHSALHVCGRSWVTKVNMESKGTVWAKMELGSLWFILLGLGWPWAMLTTALLVWWFGWLHLASLEKESWVLFPGKSQRLELCPPNVKWSFIHNRGWSPYPLKLSHGEIHSVVLKKTWGSC